MPRSTLNLEIVKGATFGPIQIFCKDALGVAMPLAGWSAFAEARDSYKTPVVINLQPVIQPDDADGLVTLSKISWETTKNYTFNQLEWDLILQNPNGDRFPPFLGGKINILNATTNPA